jgi:glycosyltransferase involved in cell wall biosynthesis
MNIGFVSTWFERGAAYVTRYYLNSVEKNNNVFVYARGGEKYAKGNTKWDKNYVTWAPRLNGTEIHWNHFKNWIKQNNIEVLFFNEQQSFEVVLKCKYYLPEVKIGSYIDYYKQDTIDFFKYFDFLICNTKRHYEVFKWHQQCYYIPWGTDVEIFHPENTNDKYINELNLDNKKTTFFHSCGMSLRKGTDILIETFINNDKIYNNSNLIIHSQLNFKETFGYSTSELRKYNIYVIEETVSHPGLYFLGDVYVYPTTLDGLGLTMYEALSVGLPVITTNEPPMNEVVNNEVGYLVDVEKKISRHDAYYWPLSFCSKKSLNSALLYYINNKNLLFKQKQKSRKYAIENFNLMQNLKKVEEIFYDSENLNHKNNDLKMALKNKKHRKIKSALKNVFDEFIPDFIRSIIYNYKFYK